jgi:hypothetical protein
MRTPPPRAATGSHRSARVDLPSDFEQILAISPNAGIPPARTRAIAPDEAADSLRTTRGDSTAGQVRPLVFKGDAPDALGVPGDKL